MNLKLSCMQWNGPLKVILEFRGQNSDRRMLKTSILNTWTITCMRSEHNWISQMASVD